MAIAVVIAVSTASGAAGAPSPSASRSAAPEKCPAGSIPAGAGCIDAKPVHIIEKCPTARKAVRFYAGRIAYWRNKMGAGGHIPRLAGRTAGKVYTSAPCPRYLAHVLQRKAYGLRKEYARWVRTRRARQLALERSHPKWIALRLLRYDREEWSCLLYISSMENARMDPTLDYGGGHGNVYEAYGIPQASPGTKMASAGPDWRTNPETQLRWMIGYARSRYGSLCGAAYNRRVRGTY